MSRFVFTLYWCFHRGGHRSASLDVFWKFCPWGPPRVPGDPRDRFRIGKKNLEFSKKSYKNQDLGYWLLVIGYSLFVIGYSLFVIRYSLLGIRY